MAFLVMYSPGIDRQGRTVKSLVFASVPWLELLTKEVVPGSPLAEVQNVVGAPIWV